MANSAVSCGAVSSPSAMQRRIAAPMPRSSHKLRAASTTPSSKTRRSRCGDLRGRGGSGDRLALVEHAVDAVDQALQGGAVELIGPAEIVHDLRLGTFRRGVPSVLGQGIVGDGGSVPILSFRDPEIHAQRLAR